MQGFVPAEALIVSFLYLALGLLPGCSDGLLLSDCSDASAARVVAVGSSAGDCCCPHTRPRV